jgi:hypothetical protein
MSPTNPFTRGALDRGKLLHVGIDGWLTAEHAGETLRVKCSELSLSGMHIEVPAAWTVGTEIGLRELEASGQRFELSGYASVSEVAADADPDGRVSACIEYVDFDAVDQSCVRAAWTFIVEQLHRDERLVMRFNWAFRDVAQLVQVCRTLLAEVDLVAAWTEAGPSELARAYLAGKAPNTAPQHRAMLDAVWKLWCGSLDIAIPPPEMPPTAQGALQALKKAIARGPTGIDEWLDVERR